MAIPLASLMQPNPKHVENMTKCENSKFASDKPIHPKFPKDEAREKKHMFLFAVFVEGGTWQEPTCLFRFVSYAGCLSVALSSLVFLLFFESWLLVVAFFPKP